MSPGPGAETGSTKSERTRRRIIESASRELARHGYGGMSLRAVASGAGLQQGSLYFHFASKDEIVEAVFADGIDHALDAIANAMSDLPDGADAASRLRAAVRAHVAALHTDQHRAAAVVRMVSTLPHDLRRTQVVHERRYVETWASLMRGARDEGLLHPDVDPRGMAVFVIWGLNSYLESERTPPSAERLDEITAGVVRLLQI